MNKMLQPKIFIQAKDSTGTMRNLSPSAWERVTGKKASRIRLDWSLKKERNLTNRQVVGTDTIALARAETATKHDTVLMANRFLKRGLMSWQ
jgi:hypothetical protein